MNGPLLQMRLASFPHELRAAWALFRSRWFTAVKIALLPFATLLLLLPYLTESAWLREEVLRAPVENLSLLTPSLFTTVLAVGSFLAFFLVNLLAKAALYHAFSAPTDIGTARAYALAARRFPSFLAAVFFLAMFVLIAVLAALSIFTAYLVLARPSIVSPATRSTLDALVTFLTVLLLVPSYLVASLGAFSPLMATRQDARTGLHAFFASAALVRRSGWPIIGRFTAWGAVFLALSASVRPLPLAQWLVPFTAALVGHAFLIVLYREVRDA